MLKLRVVNLPINEHDDDDDDVSDKQTQTYT